jgi:hypothetical protein
VSFVLPKQLKDLNALGFDLLLPVELNDVDVDRMMTPILELAVKGGRMAASTTDPKDYESRLSALRQSDKLIGFGDDRGREILDGWLRTSVVKTGTAGRRRNVAQMDYLQPLTIATYRSGLPKSRRNRRADELTYRSLLLAVRGAGQTHPEQIIMKLFMDVFGAGVDLGPMPSATPRYDESTCIDINSLLCLRLLEVFPGNAKLFKAKELPDFAVPGAVAPLGGDVLAFLRLYGALMPPAEAMSHLAALLSLRLFQLPLRTAAAAHAVLQHQPTADLDKPDADNPLEIYCDFTRRRGGPSDELSQRCVQRDLDNLGSFFADRLLLRTLYQALVLVGGGNSVREMPASQQLRAISDMRTDPEMILALRMQLRAIEQALDDSVSGDEGRAFIDEVRHSGLSVPEQLTTVLVDGLRKGGMEKQVAWFWSTGGINKTYGLLAGTQKARTTWRYAPSDELLTALLTLCFVEPSGTRTRAKLPIAEVLRRLEQRFGLLIARPPVMLDGPDSRAGAADNLDAFVRKLQLLGCFQSLSDDFSAQFVNRPREAAA